MQDTSLSITRIAFPSFLARKQVQVNQTFFFHSTLPGSHCHLHTAIITKFSAKHFPTIVIATTDYHPIPDHSDYHHQLCQASRCKIFGLHNLAGTPNIILWQWKIKPISLPSNNHIGELIRRHYLLSEKEYSFWKSPKKLLVTTILYVSCFLMYNNNGHNSLQLWFFMK